MVEPVQIGLATLYCGNCRDVLPTLGAMCGVPAPKTSEGRDLTATLRDEDERDKARAAFGAFKQWRADFAVEPHVQELSLVSEKMQYGGTIDNVAHIRNGLGLVDFKTSSKGEVYEDMVLQLAAYGILWDETHPKEPLTEGYHLILLPKDGSKPLVNAAIRGKDGLRQIAGLRIFSIEVAQNR